MNQLKHFVALISICLSTSLKSQTDYCENQIQYYKTETQKDLSEIFTKGDISKERFVESFEEYFISNNLVKKGETKGEFYKNILKFLESQGTKLPPVTEASKVAFVAGRLKITIDEIEKNNQMNYLSSNYHLYKKNCPNDTISAFYVVGDIAESSSGMQNLSNNLFASALNLFLTQEDLDQKFYRETVVMFLWFRMALYYGK